jgi:hypothetical protein
VEATPLATVTNKPDRRGEHEVTVKTIARGIPGESGVTVVTTLVCFFTFYTRGCGRIKRPAFPAPSDWEGKEFQSKTRAKRAARSRNCTLGSPPSTRLARGGEGWGGGGLSAGNAASMYAEAPPTPDP